MSASVHPPSSRVEDSGSPLLQLGALVGLAGAAALACTLPAMVRVSAVLAGNAPFVRAWAALAAAALGPMGASIFLARGAAQSATTHLFGESGARLRTFGIGLWLAALLVTLALFGSFLRATTHHRALAGVTYACGALVLGVAWALACARLVAMLRSVSERVRRPAVVILGAAALVALLVLGVSFVSTVAKDEASFRAGATVVDVMAFVLTSFIASRGWPGAHRPLVVAGPPVVIFIAAMGAVFMAALGFATLRDPPVSRAVAERAPAFAPVAEWISGRSGR